MGLLTLAFCLLAVACWCAAAAFNELTRAVNRISQKENRIMATIDEVLEGLAELPTIDEGLDAVFAALQQLIAAGQTDPAKLQQALDLITVHKDRVKADIVANTPAQP